MGRGQFLPDVNVCRFITDALGCVVTANMNQPCRVVSDFFGQLSLSSLFQIFSIFDAASGDFPAVVLTLDIAVLAYEHDMVVVDKGHDPHTIAEGHNAIDG